MRIRFSRMKGNSRFDLLIYFISVTSGLISFTFETLKQAPFYFNFALASFSISVFMLYKYFNPIYVKKVDNLSLFMNKNRFLNEFGVIAFLVVPWIQFVRLENFPIVKEYLITFIVVWLTLTVAITISATLHLKNISPEINHGVEDRNVMTSFFERYPGVTKNIPKILMFEKSGKRGGAWVSGILRKKICIDRTFWNTISEDERDALLLHEIGHIVNNSYGLPVTYSVAVSSINAYVYTNLVYFAINIDALETASLPVFSIIYNVMLLLTTLVAVLIVLKIKKFGLKINRSYQMKADRFALEHMNGNSEAVISMIKKLRVYEEKRISGKRLLYVDSTSELRIEKLSEKP
jgi:Zn-dependent protease with chaperone function